MLQLLLSRLNPYMMWAKIALLVAMFAAGYKLNDWRWTARYERERAAQQAAIIEQQTAARKKDADQATLDRAIGAAHQLEMTKLNNNLAQLRQKIAERSDGQYQTKTFDYPFTVLFVHDFNSLSIGTPDSSGMPSAATDTTRADGSTTAIADLTRKSLLTHHADQMSVCLAWKSQLESIIAWDKQTYGDK